MGIITGLINLILTIYKLLVIVHFVLKLIKVPANKWTTLLDSIIEPVLIPLRKLLNKYLPQNWRITDWSPVALFLVISVIQWIL